MGFNSHVTAKSWQRKFWFDLDSTSESLKIFLCQLIGSAVWEVLHLEKIRSHFHQFSFLNPIITQNSIL